MRPKTRLRKLPAGSAPLFAALGDEGRLRIVARLRDGGPLSITKLTTGSNISRQAVTKHLRVMGDVGLVRSTRQGRETVWELNQRRLDEARRYLDTISRQWDEKLDRLKSFVER
ncbi:MAG: ArsR/SmtB family transcription factor [Gemmatimonadaceae bacterium]